MNFIVLIVLSNSPCWNNSFCEKVKLLTLLFLFFLQPKLTTLSSMSNFSLKNALDRMINQVLQVIFCLFFGLYLKVFQAIKSKWFSFKTNGCFQGPKIFRESSRKAKRTSQSQAFQSENKIT